MSNLKTVVYQRLEAIMAAEKITKVELGHLSRELLVYTPTTFDIDIVNRLLGVLTPMNKKLAILFFKEFLPWEQEKDTEGNFQRFGKMFKSAGKVKKRTDAIEAFLKEEEANIWTWAEANVKVDKQKDYTGMISKAIKAALSGDEKTESPALSPAAIVSAIFQGGVTIADLLDGCEVRERELEKSKEESEAIMDAMAA